jgi:predicted dehydrogenase
MRFTRRTKKPEQQGWFSDPKLGGDIVLDLGIHDIDASIWFSKSELASIISHVTDQDQESFEIKLQDGSRCHFDLGWDIPATSEIGIENNFSIKTATGSFTYDGLTETITVNEVTKSVNPRFPQAYQNEIHGSIQMPHKKDSHFPTHNEIKHGLTIVEAITKERTNASN